MDIVVLNGSPKGEKSVTLQYVHFIAQRYPQHRLNILNISQRIGQLERDEAAFQAVVDAVRRSDAILWATPVYYFLVPAGYKRFIERLFESGAATAFAEKYAAALTTSIHFFDHTAHDYLHAVCDDLGMRYAGGYSADMYDLLKSAERKRLAAFAADLFRAAADSRPLARCHAPLRRFDWRYRPASPPPPTDPGRRKITLITDTMASTSNPGRMVRRMIDAFGGRVGVVDLETLDVKGSCRGCLHCAYDNACVYAGRDGYIDTYRHRIMPADILIWAGSLKDRYLSARWKQFFDRSFFMNHRPTLAGKQIGILIAGPLSQNANLREILNATVELQQANLAGIVTDEGGDSAGLDALLDALAGRLVDNARRGFVAPPTFLGVAGAKLFRDEIWGRLRFPFRADYRYYRRTDRFDFPRRDLRSRLVNAAMLLFSSHPRFRREVNRRMKDEMIRPLQKVLRRDAA